MSGILEKKEKTTPEQYTPLGQQLSTASELENDTSQLSYEQAALNSKAFTAYQPETKKNNNWLYIIAAIIVAAVVGVAALLFLR